jgi:thiamine-monophosphate kinase
MREQDIMAVITSQRRLTDPRVLLGPGDDLAALLLQRQGGGGALLLGVDQVIDGLHVHAHAVSWDRIGRKAVHRSLSDVAAMAGRPLATLAAVVVPTSAEVAEIEALCSGLNAAATAWEAPLVGGDVAIQRDAGGPLTISVTVLATADEALGPVSRGGGRAGDVLLVTGHLGGSLKPDGTGHHLDFIPRVDEAHAAADLLGESLHAMIDISDGLGRDAARLAAASGLQAQINMARLPLRAGAGAMDALQDGEDYELLMAVDARATVPASLEGRHGRCPLTVIGSLGTWEASTHRVVVTEPGGTQLDGSKFGWDHG